MRWEESIFEIPAAEDSFHAFLLIKIFPNNTIKSHAIITVIAAPHLYLSGSFAPGISFITDAWAVGVLGILASATPSDEPFTATSVSFLIEGCVVGALGSSSPFLTSTSGFETAAAGGCAAANGSWD
jgi:hypothetical protein